MKIVLLCLFFVLIILIAICVYYRYYIRSILFKDIVYLCKSLKNNISFNKNQIKKILNDSMSKVSVHTKYIFKQGIGCRKILINKGDYVLIKDFFESIGKGDVTFEINNINYYENNFEELRDTSKDRLEKEGKMYLKLIIGVGLAICIILI
jgi:hypothetical protein